MTRKQLKRIIKEAVESIVNEDGSTAYQDFVQKVMDKFGVDRIESMSDEKKKRFFDYLDQHWNAGENETDVDEYASSEDDEDVEVKASHGDIVKIRSTGQYARIENVYAKQPSDRTQYHVMILTAGDGKKDYDLKRKYLLQGHEFDTELRKGQFKKELSRLSETKLEEGNGGYENLRSLKDELEKYGKVDYHAAGNLNKTRLGFNGHIIRIGGYGDTLYADIKGSSKPIELDKDPKKAAMQLKKLSEVLNEQRFQYTPTKSDQIKFIGTDTTDRWWYRTKTGNRTQQFSNRANMEKVLKGIGALDGNVIATISQLQKDKLAFFKGKKESVDESVYVFTRKNFTSKDVINWNELSPEAKDVFNMCDTVNIVSPQEVMGYVGRTGIFSALAFIEGEGNKTKVTFKSMGWKIDGVRGQWKSKLHEGISDGTRLFYYTDAQGKLRQIPLPHDVLDGRTPAKTVRGRIPKEAYRDLIWNLKMDKKERGNLRESSKLNEGMTLDQIKKAVDSGKTVHWSNKGYTVTKDKNGEYLIQHTKGNTIGLTRRDGKTLNGDTSEFFMAESKLNEGKKRFNIMQNVGKSKYVVNYHDGKKTHKDGSDFFDIRIFKNKPDTTDFIDALMSKGYSYDSSLNENQRLLDKIGDKLAELELKGKENTPEYKALEKKWKELDAKFGEGVVREYYRPYTSRSGDPKWIRAKYAGTAEDGTPFKKGEQVLYWPRGGKNGKNAIMVGKQADKEWREFQSNAADEEWMAGQFGSGMYREGVVKEGITTSDLSSIKPREIVSLASKKTKNTQISLWLDRDERGKFEQIVRHGIEILKQGSEDSLKSYTLKTVKDELADYVLYYALQAAIRDAQKELPSKKPSLNEEPSPLTYTNVKPSKFSGKRFGQLKVGDIFTSWVAAGGPKAMAAVFKKIDDDHVEWRHGSKKGKSKMPKDIPTVPATDKEFNAGKINESLNEAAKAGFGTHDGFNTVVKINGVDPQFFKQPFGRRTEALRTIQDWKKDAKKDYVDAKGKSTMASVKAWVKEVNPSEFYARWKPDSSSYKDDSVEIFYKR